MDGLPDGIYDAMVIEAEPVGDDAVRIELAVSSGTHRGDVVAVRTSAVGGGALDLLGLPATVTVRDGVPSVSFS